MRVRKKTSKRVSTRMREGIKKKAAAQNRKDRKLAKKDVTWKSRVQKDPGIPSNFPYKNKILETIEQKKRLDMEERERKRAERIEAKRCSVEESAEMSDGEDMEDAEDGATGLEALMESAQRAAKEYDGSDDMDLREEDLSVTEYDVNFYEDSEEGESELEKSRKAYDKVFKYVVDASDVVLYVLDARDPEGTRSRKVEHAVLQSQGKRLILVLNKIDLVPPTVLEQWLTFLKSSFPTVPFRASPGATNASSFNKKLTQAATASGLLDSLKIYANNSNLKRSIVVGVIGYPNVGKSSVINALTSRKGGSSKACPVGNQAGVTTSLREVKIDNKLKILDSPGICFPGESSKKGKTEQEAELALLNALPHKYNIDPYPAVLKLVKRLSQSDEMTSSFKAFYEIPPIAASDPDQFTKQFLIHVARKRGRLSKGGIPNLSSAGMSVLNDWRDGKILGWVLPNSSKASATEVDKQKETLGTGATHAPKKVEQTTIVQQWSKEFDLDGLFTSLDKAVQASNEDALMKE